MKWVILVAILILIGLRELRAAAERHWVRERIYIGLPLCPDGNSWYLTETDVDHVEATCAHLEDGPEPSE